MIPPRSTGLIALVLAGVVVAIHAPIVIGGRTWDDARYHTEIAPPRLAAADALAHAELPQWWDGSGLGVPLLGEPSHGAAYPPVWLAATPHALDLIWILHVLWCALGVALWARRLGASWLAAVVAGASIATTGVIASAAIRGALPALAHLPWVGVAAKRIVDAGGRRARLRASILLAAMVGLIGLAGQAAVLAQAVALACLTGWPARRSLIWPIAAGVSIGALQWLPALLVDGAALELHALPLARMAELVVPGGSGSATSWFPSVYIGAPMLALAALGGPARSMSTFAAVLALLGFVVGRGGWAVGVPELQLGALAILAAAYAGPGFDAALTGGRRAMITMACAAASVGLALGARVGERGHGTSTTLDRALIDGGVTLACLALAVIVIWQWSSRARAVATSSLVVATLVIAPSVVARPAFAPTHDREIVEAQPAWLRDVAASGPAPVRVFRPLAISGQAPQTLDVAISELAGASASLWGLAAAPSRDAARSTAEDRVWLAAAAAGGQLLDRYGVQLAMVPSSLADARALTVLARRGTWSIVRYPASPPAALVFEWMWAADEATALARLFPPGAGHGLAAGVVVLSGAGVASQDEPSDPVACAIERWRPGAIDLACSAPRPAYAVVSSTAAAGWSARVDGRAAAWQLADVMRRGVPVSSGAHRIAWRYTAPGLRLGAVLTALGIAALCAWWLTARRE